MKSIKKTTYREETTGRIRPAARWLFGLTLLAFIITGTGCKKDKEPAVDNSSCEIVSVKGASQEYVITHNASGRLESVTYNGYALDNFSYLNNTMTVMSTQNGVFSRKSTFTFNSDGLVTLGRIEYDAAGNTWNNHTYQYSGTQLSSSVLTKHTGSVSNRTYTWSNGNLTKATVHTNNVLTQTIEYEYYTDKPYQKGDSRHWEKTVNGTESVRSKNLLKKITSKYIPDNSTEVTNYTYQFDADGKIVAMTEAGASNSSTYTYQYKCK